MTNSFTASPVQTHGSPAAHTSSATEGFDASGTGRVHGYLALGCAVALALTFAATYSGGTNIELSFMRWINSFAAKSALLDHIAVSLTYVTFSGALLLACIWHCWFASNRDEDRLRILAGLFAVFAAAALSRGLQLVLPTHVRPLHDPALAFTPPFKLDPAIFNHWNSFPSDHAAVYFGLVALAYLVRRPAAHLVLGIVLVLSLARIYLGIHFPTDVIGGGALGILIVLALCRSRLVLALGGRIVRYERLAPALFYPCAFFLSYEMATLFDEVRAVVKGLAVILAGRA